LKVVPAGPHQILNLDHWSLSDTSNREDAKDAKKKRKGFNLFLGAFSRSSRLRGLFLVAALKEGRPRVEDHACRATPGFEPGLLESQ